LGISFLLLSIVTHVNAIIENRTIDDTNGDSVTHVVPDYNNGDGSANVWNAQPGCSGCTLKPDASKAFDNTWHDNMYFGGTPLASVNITFTGTAIWVYNIVPNSNTTGFPTNLEFYLDGTFDRTFKYTPSYNQTDFLYDFVVYQREVDNGTHVLEMTLGNDPTQNSVMLFDYALYTYNGPDGGSTATGSSKNHIAVIVAPVVVCVVVLAALIAAAIYLRRRRALRSKGSPKSSTSTVPFAEAPVQEIMQIEPSYNPPVSPVSAGILRPQSRPVYRTAPSDDLSASSSTRGGGDVKRPIPDDMGIDPPPRSANSSPGPSLSAHSDDASTIAMGISQALTNYEPMAIDPSTGPRGSAVTAAMQARIDMLEARFEAVQHMQHTELEPPPSYPEDSD